MQTMAAIKMPEPDYSSKERVASIVKNIKPDTKDTLKYASLVTLTIQNTALNLTLRMARTQKDLFISSTAVIMSELFKLFTCIIMIRIDEGNWPKMVHSLKSKILDRPYDTLKVAVPAIVYYIQNNLIYIGATHLDAATCQVTYQLKILTTAVLSVVMLRKQLASIQWASLVILFVGVTLVQLEQITSKAKTSSPNEQHPLIGLGAIFLACCLSGFAGVYFEKILKGTAEVSLWIRNVQLSVIAAPFGLFQILLTDRTAVNEKGFFFGYSPIVWTVVLLQAQGGLLVAVVVKYADNILKGFATSLAIILSCIVSVIAFDFHLTPQFTMGAALVIFSVFLYSKPVPNKK